MYSNNIIYHRDIMKSLFEAYSTMDRTEFVLFAISKEVDREHAIIIWQTLDIYEEHNSYISISNKNKLPK